MRYNSLAKTMDLQCNIYRLNMNCARVLHAFGSQPQPTVIPVDLAVYLSLSQHQPLYQLLSMSPLKSTQRHNCMPRARLHCPSFSFSSSSLPSSPLHLGPRSCFRRDSGGVSKKHVVFADAKGLALTAVRLFIPEPFSHTSTLVLKPSLAKLHGQQSTSNKLSRYKLRLGFPQPTLDFKVFLARLREMHVQLESCNISEHSLSGKVCVSHVSIEKAVHIRLTFDSWRSHHDIPCMLLQQQRYAGSDLDIFSFDFSLPQNIDPNERTEFCVSFRPGASAAPHWDNNKGQNYRLCMEKDESNVNHGNANCYGPMLSKHKPPSWPSHMSLSMQSTGDHLQKSLSSRVRSEWKHLHSAK
uniref:CBM21 domain-containing protein n=1 Tax=Monopterus albus TaxID=43700 RepID=A0A3Q3QA00_MONAL|nr:protein phosphatase 1 regulatory subunit 3C-B-like [Monopterus albus]XP_020456619.1 protein phosphatase 1 regulatory subunit 3C-B-like [Monopterus albus]